jgi:hypothetical protein
VLVSIMSKFCVQGDLQMGNCITQYWPRRRMILAS